MEAVLSTAETTRPRMRPRMNWILVLSGTKRRRNMVIPLDAQCRWTAAAQPDRDHPTHEDDGGEHRGADAEADGDGKTLHRTGAQYIKDRHLDQRRHIGIENGRKRAPESGVQRRDGGTAELGFLADAFVDQHVG